MSKKDINFEDAISKLNEIAEELESGNLSLDESMAKFEEGMKLSKSCKEMIDTAEKKITMLITDEGKIEEFFT